MSKCNRPDRTGGVGQKSERPVAPAPHPFSRADFFRAGVVFDLFGHPIDAPKGSPSRAGRRGPRKTTASADAVRRLAEEGHTRRQIAKQTGISQSTLYANYFRELGVRAGQPGRRRHDPTPYQRRLVVGMVQAGSPRSEIAEALGISLPTLRLHYPKELEA